MGDGSASPAESVKPAVRLWGFLKMTLSSIVTQRRWVLFPLWVLLAVLALLLVLTGNSALLPAIYLAF